MCLCRKLCDFDVITAFGVWPTTFSNFRWHTAFCKKVGACRSACSHLWHSRMVFGPTPRWVASCPIKLLKLNMVSALQFSLRTQIIWVDLSYCFFAFCPLVHQYLELEGPTLLNMRIKHLIKVDSVEKAAVLSKVCSEYPGFEGQGNFKQTYLLCACMTKSQEQLMEEVRIHFCWFFPQIVQFYYKEHSFFLSCMGKKHNRYLDSPVTPVSQNFRLDPSGCR